MGVLIPHKRQRQEREVRALRTSLAAMASENLGRIGTKVMEQSLAKATGQLQRRSKVEMVIWPIHAMQRKNQQARIKDGARRGRLRLVTTWRVSVRKGPFRAKTDGRLVLKLFVQCHLCSLLALLV